MTEINAQPTKGAHCAVNQLIADAELVADVAVGLGRLQNLQLLPSIQALKNAVASGADIQQLIPTVRASLNAAVKDIAPIGLRDLRAGWSPFTTKVNQRPVFFFGLFAIVLICFTALTTSFYKRMVFAHASLLEIQAARVSEQVMKFYDTFKNNEPEIMQAVKAGNTRDAVLDSFYKNYFDLRSMDEKLAVMYKDSTALMDEAAIVARLTSTVGKIVTWSFRSKDQGVPLGRLTDQQVEHNVQQIQVWQQGYGKGGMVYSTNVEQPTNTQNAEIAAVIGALHLFFFNAAAFSTEAHLESVNPVTPIPIYEIILHLRDTMNSFSLWYLPALYAMLGSTVFHMRRFLDPNLPNAPSLRTAYRVFLGAFAGIVVVWFWAPSPNTSRGGEQEFLTLSSFSVAFLVGFSIDTFFQALDRLVTKVGQAIG